MECLQDGGEQVERNLVHVSFCFDFFCFVLFVLPAPFCFVLFSLVVCLLFPISDSFEV